MFRGWPVVTFKVLKISPRGSCAPTREGPEGHYGVCKHWRRHVCSQCGSTEHPAISCSTPEADWAPEAVSTCSPSRASDAALTPLQVICFVAPVVSCFIRHAVSIRTGRRCAVGPGGRTCARATRPVRRSDTCSLPSSALARSSQRGGGAGGAPSALRGSEEARLSCPLRSAMPAQLSYSMFPFFNVVST